jgi:hypothetical protein
MKTDSVDDANLREWTPITATPAGNTEQPRTPEQAILPRNAHNESTAPEPFVGDTTALQPASPGPPGYSSPSSAPSSTSSSAPTETPPASPASATLQATRPHDGTAQWLPANQPGVLPPNLGHSLPTSSVAVAGQPGAPSASSKTEAVRHGGPFSRNAWRWSLAVVAAIIGIIVVIEIGLSKLIDHFERGTPQRLAVICASLFSNDVVMLGVLIVAAKALGMSFRSFGVRRPADVKESIVLAFAAWLIFLLLGGVWAMVSQSAAEREANNPFLRDKTVNTRDASALGLPDGSDAASSEISSAQDNSTDRAVSTDGRAGSGETSGETSGFSNDAGAGKVTEANKRTDQDATPQNKDVADNRHALIKVLNDDPPKALLLSILITGCIGAPLLEELLVRGFMFGAFSQRFGKLAGGAISSLLFGFAHIMAYPLKMIPPLVIMGAALAWLAWQTGSIVPGMFIHAFVNSLGLGIAASLGGHIITLMVGSWLVLGIILLPWIRQKKSPAAPAGI